MPVRPGGGKYAREVDRGYFIAAPASSVGTAAGRVVLAGTLATWTVALRCRGDQIQQSLGVLGNVN
jgi:hypothetical protein